MITQVSVTRRHGFFLHNERDPFIPDAHDSSMMTTVYLCTVRFSAPTAFNEIFLMAKE